MTLKFLAYIAVLSPFLGFLSVGVGIRYVSDRLSQIITCTLMFAATLASLALFKGIVIDHDIVTLTLFSWIHVGDFKVDWGMRLDTLSVTMIAVVNLVSSFVHLYSVGYMAHDRSIPRFMSYLSLFTFMMLMLVTAPNLVQLFFGWEGVGLASYLLIGFWYEKASANDAAMKAFIVNRVGDVGLALGVAAIFTLFNTVTFEGIFSALTPYSSGVMVHPTLEFWGQSFDAFNLIGVLLFIGAMGKSAQIGLHVWLPDAMEGPTPVSALIHAATMVTAGVFLVCRLSPLYELAPFARDVIIFIGATTAIFAASVALTQTDIKRVIAYSTCSQLGYMFFAAGASAYGAAMFHLVTHAFFKALLFLGAGSVIHAMSDEQDMTRMGGIYKLIPQTYAVMWIGSLALAGIPLFAGYYSKDAIIESAYLTGTSLGHYAFYAGVVVAFMTAFYSWRLLLLTFHGSAHGDEKVMAHVHESPWTMMVPLALLSLGAIFSGYLGHSWFVGEGASTFWNGALVVTNTHHDLPVYIYYSPLMAAVSGILMAYLFYGGKRQLPSLLAKKLSWLYQISKQKWYVDELYGALFLRPALQIGRFFWKRGDEKTIDYFGPDGLTKLSFVMARFSSFLQTGYLYHYAFGMIIGVLLLIGWALMESSQMTHWYHSDITSDPLLTYSTIQVPGDSHAQ